MKRLALVALLLSSCATSSGRWWEPDWEFDCDWATFWDYQNNIRNRSMGLPFVSNFKALYCDLDPTVPAARAERQRERLSRLPVH